MMYQRIKPAKVCDVIVQQFEQMIVEGTLSAGQKLPAERELAKQFEVSRPSLREAIQKLAAKGILESRQGGGTFVSKTLGSSLSDPLLNLMASYPEAQYDLLEYRHALDGLCAYYAAIRSTDVDRDNILQKHQQFQQAHQSKQLAQEVVADVELHLAIAEATHNLVLLHMMRAMYDLLKQHIKDNLRDIYPQQANHDNIHDQHKLLVDAIIEGDPEKAKLASHDHFVLVEEALLEQAKEQTRIERSLRRISTNR